MQRLVSAALPSDGQFQIRHNRLAEQFMITLATFGPAFGLPDPSPFVTKAEVLLKMSELPFTAKPMGVRKAPKGKLPYIEDDGQLIADSTFIRLHLERKYNIEFDRGLTPAQKGAAWATEKMLEDQFYWVIVSERWLDDANFAKGPAMFFSSIPAPIRPIIVRVVRRGLRKTLLAHGLGRHNEKEIQELGERAIMAVADQLGSNEYLTGSQPCGADATVYAFMSGALCTRFDSKMRPYVAQQSNIVRYCERMRDKFHPNLAR
jgi:glutathione S-transferase